MIHVILQSPIPNSVVKAAESLIDYGILGAVLLLALSGIFFMYTTNNKREKERYDATRLEIQTISTSNREERERWQEIDSQRFEVLQNISRNHNEASVKVAVALEQLGTIIKERIK